MDTRYLCFPTSTEFIRIPLECVTHIEADGNYSVIHTADGTPFLISLQLGKVELIISESVEPGSSQFIRIGKSLIVNKDYITLIRPSQQKLVVSDCRSFKIELNASKDALKSLKDFMKGECEE